MQKRSLDGLRARLLRHLAQKISRGNELLNEYVNRIKSRAPSSTILLFGSRARDGHLPYSDYDIAIVLEKVVNKIRVMEEFRKLKPRGLDLDLIVIELDELDDPIIKNMLRGSRILYDGLGIKERIKSL